MCDAVVHDVVACVVVVAVAVVGLNTDGEQSFDLFPTAVVEAMDFLRELTVALAPVCEKYFEG